MTFVLRADLNVSELPSWLELITRSIFQCCIFADGALKPKNGDSGFKEECVDGNRAENEMCTSNTKADDRCDRRAEEAAASPQITALQSGVCRPLQPHEMFSLVCPPKNKLSHTNL